MTIRTASLIHITAGLAALVLALYMLFSESLSFGSELGWAAQRPRITVSLFFVVAAWLLITGALRRRDSARRIIGYASIGLGFLTAWLVQQA